MLSGVLRTNAYENSRYYEVRWNATQDIPSNTSTINWELYAMGSVSYAERTVNLRIDGNTVFSKLNRVMRSQGLVTSGQIPIGHWSDGNRYFLIEFEAAVYTSSITVSAASNFTLDTIPRSSYMTSLSNYIIGNTINLYVHRYSTAFTCQFWFKLGNSGWYDCGTGWGTTQSGNDIYINFVIPMNWCKYIPNSTSGTLEMCLRTYDNYGNHIGYDEYKNVTVYIDRNRVYPTFPENPVISLYNTNSVVDKWGLCVAGFSRYKITGTALGAEGSTPSIYKVEKNGISNSYSTKYNSTDQKYHIDYTSDILYQNETPKLYIMDSRGVHSYPYEFKQMVVQNYYKPVISSFWVERAGEISKASIDKNTITAFVDFNHAPILKNGVDVNKTKAVLYYRKTGDINWILSEELQNRVAIEIPNFNEILSYDFKVEVIDSLDSKAVSNDTISTKSVLMNFHGQYTGLAIGKISEYDNTFEINLNSKIYKPIYLENLDKVVFKNNPNYGTNDFRGCYFEYLEGTNYSCFKYANGVMRLTQRVKFNGVFDKQYGTIWTALANLGNFAVPFIKKPMIESVINTSVITFWLDSMDSTNVMTATKIGSMYFSRGSTASSNECSVEITVVGRWK